MCRVVIVGDKNEDVRRVWVEMEDIEVRSAVAE